jgi:outer membrane protein OmpA-like peptidoglycan-associated protein
MVPLMVLNRYMWCLAPLLLASGCTTYSLQELRSAKPGGTPFQNQLAKRYLAFSEDEAKNYDWADSSYFADKGLKAAYGNDVAPEALGGRSLLGRRRAELEAARNALLEVQKAKGGEKPELAADAQFFFDCWVENAEEDWQPDEIAFCRDGFDTAMRDLTYVPPPPEPVVAPEPLPPAPVEAPPPPQKLSYMVLFGTNISKLDEEAIKVVDKVVEDLKKMNDPHYIIVLNGHADTVGSTRYNFDLSRRRADAVEKELVKRGIVKEYIRPFAFGETDPAISTPDNTPEPRNRRVEIFLGD